MLDEAVKEGFSDMVITGLRFVKNNDYALMDLYLQLKKYLIKLMIKLITYMILVHQFVIKYLKES